MVSFVQALTGASLSPETKQEYHKLLTAASQNNVSVLQSFLAGDPTHPEHVKTKENRNLLHMAAWEGAADALEILLQNRKLLKSVNARDSSQRTPLHLAAAIGCERCTQQLLIAKAWLDPRDVGRRTPLHLAARFEQARTVRVLLDVFADPTIKDSYGLTAAQMVKNSKDPDIADLDEVMMQRVKERPRGASFCISRTLQKWRRRATADLASAKAYRECAPPAVGATAQASDWEGKAAALAPTSRPSGNEARRHAPGDELDELDLEHIQLFSTDDPPAARPPEEGPGSPTSVLNVVGSTPASVLQVVGSTSFGCSSPTRGNTQKSILIMADQPPSETSEATQGQMRWLQQGSTDVRAEAGTTEAGAETAEDIPPRGNATSASDADHAEAARGNAGNSYAGTVCLDAGPATFVLAFFFDETVSSLGFDLAWHEEPVVDNVVPEGAAAAVGLASGDCVFDINGTATLGRGREDLIPLLKARPLFLRVKREVDVADRSHFELKITIGDGDRQSSPFDVMSCGQYPVVYAVRHNGDAAIAGVLEGDAIVSANGRSLKQASRSTIQTAIKERPLDLTIWRRPTGADLFAPWLARGR